MTTGFFLEFQKWKCWAN